MVYLREVIQTYRQELLEDDSIQCFLYYYLSDHGLLNQTPVNLIGDEETLAARGYKGSSPVDEEVQAIINRKPIKGIDYTTNIFKLLGIHLASGCLLSDKIDIKFNQSSLKYKYVIKRVLPEYEEQFTDALLNADVDLEFPYADICNFIYQKDIKDDNIEPFLSEILKRDLDIIDLLILEDVERVLLSNSIPKIQFQNLSAREIAVQVLEQFSNAVKKITHARRKGHESFIINDEYDVQDLLYVMLKPLFPKLTDEEPTPKVGAKYNKIDLIIREEGIMIEVKMIKEKDRDEKDFIEQLKNDIQSYYKYKFLKDLLIFVYDPQNKTRDIQNFYDLNGTQEINEVRFNIKVIVGN
ncbi:MAG: hypothetical protein KDD92_02825 [Caldilineaceae bacterium]|nr:hypothetical protein [Caldilineaceae bacterium]